jgi:hypothetical protein
MVKGEIEKKNAKKKKQNTIPNNIVVWVWLE